MEVLGDDWNILELHWTTCKFLLGFSPFFATGRVCKGTAIKSEFHWQLLFDLLPIAAEFRPVCDEQSESLLCPQTDALLSAQFQLHGTLCSTCICFVFFFLKMGVTQNLQNCTFFNCILNDAIERASWFCSTCILSRSPEARVGMGRSSMVYQWAH
jgi:hypothetical protein